jgi:hypothetical protein
LRWRLLLLLLLQTQGIGIQEIAAVTALCRTVLFRNGLESTARLDLYALHRSTSLSRLILLRLQLL